MIFGSVYSSGITSDNDRCQAVSRHGTEAGVGRKSRSKAMRRASRIRTSDQRQPLRPSASIERAADPAEHLRLLADRQRVGQLELEKEIRRLIGDGHSWSLVAGALGMSRQGARQRYKRLLDDGQGGGRNRAARAG